MTSRHLREEYKNYGISILGIQKRKAEEIIDSINISYHAKKQRN